jgi:predicted P-loop ATPase
MSFLKELFQEHELLIENDSTDYIKAISTLVKTTDSERFEKTFKEWVIDSVANIYNLDKNTNKKCIVLCGGQGFHKTSFAALLCPASKCMSEFPLFNKEALTSLIDTFLIVLDEVRLDKLSFSQLDKLKQLILMDKVAVRPFYSKEVGVFPRVSNFIATTNLKSNEIAKGRFLLSFDLVEPIDMQAFCKIDINKMWGQAHKIVMKRIKEQREGL